MKMKGYRFIVPVSLALLSAAGCNCDDVSYWEPEQPGPKLSGMVVTNGSKPLAGAEVVVTVGNSVHSTTTDADGIYSFDEIEAGEAQVTSSYSPDPDIKSSSRNVELKMNTMTTCNFLLVKAVSDYTKDKVGDDDLYSISLPDLVEEDKSVTQIATFYVSAGTLDDGDELELEAWYELGDDAVSKTKGSWKYTDNDVVVCVNSASKSGAKTSKKPIKVTVQQLVNPKQTIHNGKEVQVEHVSDQYTYFNTSELGKTMFYYPIMVNDMESGYETRVFTPETVYGYTDRIDFSCMMKYGTEYVFKMTFLDQYVTLIEGGSLKEVKKDFSVGKSVPAGEAVVISGNQKYYSRSYKCEYAETSVKIWSDISYTFTDRHHTGGSN